jgi:hypothetical protein
MGKLPFANVVLLAACGAGVRADDAETQRRALAALREADPIVKVDEAKLEKPVVSIQFRPNYGKVSDDEQGGRESNGGQTGPHRYMATIWPLKSRHGASPNLSKAKFLFSLKQRKGRYLWRTLNALGAAEGGEGRVVSVMEKAKSIVTGVMGAHGDCATSVLDRDVPPAEVEDGSAAFVVERGKCSAVDATKDLGMERLDAGSAVVPAGCLPPALVSTWFSFCWL